MSTKYLLLAAFLGAAPTLGAAPAMCKPPTEPVTGKPQHLGRLSYVPPNGYGFSGGSDADIRAYENQSRLLWVTSDMNQFFAASSDLLPQSTCEAVIDNHAVRITIGNMELESSSRMAGPGRIGRQNIAVAEWEDRVDGHVVGMVLISRSEAQLEHDRSVIWSMRIQTDPNTAMTAAAPAQLATAVATPVATAIPDATPALADTVWRAVHTDTIGDLVMATQSMGGRFRFSARGLKQPTPVTSSDFSRDSVTTWLASIDQLAASSSPKVGDMRSIGGAVAITVTTTADGKNAFGCYVQDSMSDNTLALALTRDQVARFTAGIRAGLAAAS